MAVRNVTPDNRDHWLKLRSNNVNSTEISALFGVNKYLTKFELYHRFADPTYKDSFTQTERTIWGSRLEPAIANGINEDLKFKNFRKKEEYIWDEELRLGSSFDYEFEDDDGKGILEIKNVDSLIFRDEWLEDEDGNLEAPPHIELQIQQQMLLSGKKQAMIGACVGGNSITYIKRKADPEIQSMIVAEVKRFWDMVKNKVAPVPDFKKDAEFIIQLYQNAHPGKTLNAKDNSAIEELVMEYKKATDAAKIAESARQAAKAQLLMLIDDCDKVIGNGYSITAGLIGPCEMNYVRDGYRLFRVNWPRGKK